jgi:transcriptional regulator with PAS, ATPase and Fis domain
MDRVRRLVSRVADANCAVLIRGETGTGKEIVARALHESSSRRDQPFIAVNCSALPGALIESLIFGHERGAFTGADRRVRGQLELARAGTLLLDEIAEMPAELQAKLLRVLEDRRFRPLGAEAEISVRARILAATHVDLERRISEGRFREDLYYRLNVLPIVLPPLRSRTEDIPALVAYFVDAFNREFRKKVRGVSDEAMRRLRSYGWPGNVRELRNAVERAMLLAEEHELTADRFPVVSASPRLTEGVELPATGIDLERLERSLVVQALERSGWNQTRAAALLGLNRDQIRYRIEKFKLERPAAT